MPLPPAPAKRAALIDPAAYEVKAAKKKSKVASATPHDLPSASLAVSATSSSTKRHVDKKNKSLAAKSQASAPAVPMPPTTSAGAGRKKTMPQSQAGRLFALAASARLLAALSPRLERGGQRAAAHGRHGEKP